MREKKNLEFTVRVAGSIPKKLNSRDSAERLVRNVISMWRERSDEYMKNSTTLNLDFNGIESVSESAVAALVEFRLEFAEDKNPEIEFSNLPISVSKTIASVERSIRHSSGRIASRKKKKGYLIEI
ncbi:MAG TPA: hypothetical protein VIS48_03625 [Candidatus Kryptonia bacterium]